jgi:hypothetical protein
MQTQGTRRGHIGQQITPGRGEYTLHEAQILIERWRHHSNRHNHRFRHYVSRRLITQGIDPTGWRLPALQFEALVLTVLRRHLQNRADRHDLMATPDAKHAAN